jgi:hypothetical protein
MEKETKRVMGTHVLESADGGASQSGKGNRAGDGHSCPGERGQREKSEWEKEPSEQWELMG